MLFNLSIFIFCLVNLTYAPCGIEQKVFIDLFEFTTAIWSIISFRPRKFSPNFSFILSIFMFCLVNRTHMLSTAKLLNIKYVIFWCRSNVSNANIFQLCEKSGGKFINIDKVTMNIKISHIVCSVTLTFWYVDIWDMKCFYIPSCQTYLHVIYTITWVDFKLMRKPL